MASFRDQNGRLPTTRETWLLSAVVLATLCGSGCDATSLHHVYNLATQPTDLYAPIMTDSYFFGQAGEERTYELEPRYRDYYELGVIARDRPIAKDRRFEGLVRLELLDGEKTIESMDLDRIRARYFAKDGDGGARRVSLASFSLPVSFWGRKNTRMRLTVIEPEVHLALAGSLEIYVAVAAIP